MCHARLTCWKTLHMHAKWESLRVLASVHKLYSEELETERLPFAVRDALGDQLHLEKLPKDSASARKSFLSSLSAQLKQDEAAKKLWTDWIKGQSSVPAERSEAIMRILTVSLEEEAALAQQHALEQQENTQQYEPELDEPEGNQEAGSVKADEDDDRSYEMPFLLPARRASIDERVQSLTEFLKSNA